MPNLIVSEIPEGGDHGDLGSHRPGDVAVEIVQRS